MQTLSALGEKASVYFQRRAAGRSASKLVNARCNSSRRCTSVKQYSARTPTAKAQFAAKLVARLVAHFSNIKETDLFGDSRGMSEISRARQVAMYLLHTSLSMPYVDVAALFRRDRTTVAHACRTVEDLRDDPIHDDNVAKLESILELLAQLAGIDEDSFLSSSDGMAV